jgi:hypothetical protein
MNGSRSGWKTTALLCVLAAVFTMAAPAAARPGLSLIHN